MGPNTSRERSKEQQKKDFQAKTKRQVESMYEMFDETIDVVTKSRSILSDYDRSNGLVSCSNIKNIERIGNLQNVLQQLLQSFKNNSKYVWGLEINKQFRLHFKRCFEEVWPINKEQFYQIILSQSRFQTIDFQNDLEEVARHMDMSIPNRRSYKQFFYQVGANRLGGHLPSSFVEESEQFSEDFSKQSQQQKGQFNLNAINATIINGDHDPNEYQKSHYELPDQQKTQQIEDFLPLFLKTQQKSAKKIQEHIPNKINNQKISEQSLQEKIKKIKQARIQNSSVIMPQTVFINRLSEDAKNQIGDLVRFYKQFSNALQRLFFSVSLISSPFKHFLFVFTEKLNRKNIRYTKVPLKKSKSSSQNSSKRSKPVRQLLYEESKQAKQYRELREINNNLILQEIRDFTQAYTDFIWKYLELSDIVDLKLGKMISIENLYGIVLKSVWRFVQFISERGSEYEEWKIEEYYKTKQIPNRTHITEQKKKYLRRVLKKLLGEHNPQKYLKKIVVFYRQASACGTCADDLLNIYQQLIVKLIKQDRTRELGIFRMKNVIQKVLKIDDNYNGGGEIGYSWITWCVIVQKLKAQIVGKSFKRQQPESSQIYTQPDHQMYYEEQL